MNNIFITGANGFLGSNVVKHFLEIGEQVVAVIRSGGKQDKLASFDCRVIEYDGSIDSLQKHLNCKSIVVHTASYYVAEHNQDDVSALVNSNIQYGLNLLEAMRLSGANKIINIGTAWQGYKGEKRRPVNLYAATKQTFEDFIAYYCDAEGFSAISFRLNDTYGEEDRRMKVIRLLIDAGIKNKPLDMSKGEQLINLIHVQDVCRMIEDAAQNMPRRNDIEICNLISKNEFTLRELVKIIEEVLSIVIPVNWGSRKYRRREVMVPFNSESFKYISGEKSLNVGIQKTYQNMKVK